MGKIKVSVATAGKMGPLTKTAVVYSNDRIDPMRTVLVQMNITAP